VTFTYLFVPIYLCVFHSPVTWCTFNDTQQN